MDMTPNALDAIITQRATEIATQIVNQKLVEAQYTVPKVPDHHHNGTDSSRIDVVELSGTYTLPSTPYSVASPGLLNDQSINQGGQSVGYGKLTAGNNPATKGVFTTYPIPIIYGNGVGVSGSFNGGKAPIGTMIFFTNLVDYELYVNYDGTNWKGVSCTLTA